MDTMFFMSVSLCNGITQIRTGAEATPPRFLFCSNTSSRFFFLCCNNWFLRASFRRVFSKCLDDFPITFCLPLPEKDTIYSLKNQTRMFCLNIEFVAIFLRLFNYLSIVSINIIFVSVTKYVNIIFAYTKILPLRSLLIALLLRCLPVLCCLLDCLSALGRCVSCFIVFMITDSYNYSKRGTMNTNRHAVTRVHWTCAIEPQIYIDI